MQNFGLSRRGFIGAAGISLLSLSAPRAFAKDAVPANLTQQDRADISRIEDYMNGITTMQAKFQQDSAQGSVFGMIYVKRPGFLRVQYDPPSQVLLVADRIAVSYYDGEIDQLNQAPLDLSPLWFLLRDKVKLGGDVTVTSFERGPNAFRIGIQETDHPEAGKVTLVLGDHPLELQQWSLVDDKNQEVRVGLFNAEFGLPLNNSLFRTPEKKKRQQGTPNN
ncbi:MAG TPA: outer membrane lipoprotein carrier protein LolA [Dongiaceae bacterium]